MAAVMAHSANKRKRDAVDIPNVRSAPGIAPESDFAQQYINEDATDNAEDFSSVLAQQSEPADANQSAHAPIRSRPNVSDTATAALAHYTMTVPQSTEQTFLNQSTENGARDPQTPDQRRTSGYGADVDFAGQQHEDGAAVDDRMADGGTTTHLPDGRRRLVVGSDEWHRVRRDNHKEVERRRRETINEGINELQKIVPGGERNKGSILARAVQFIRQLKENESQNIEKWTLEKMLTEQAIAELSSSCDKLKTECQRAWAECEQWKNAAQKAGIEVEVSEKADVDDDD